MDQVGLSSLSIIWLKEFPIDKYLSIGNPFNQMRESENEDSSEFP